MLCRAFENKLYFKDIKFPDKVRHIYNIKKKKELHRIWVFGYENKEKYPPYVAKNTFRKYINL